MYFLFSGRKMDLMRSLDKCRLGACPKRGDERRTETMKPLNLDAGQSRGDKISGGRGLGVAGRFDYIQVFRVATLTCPALMMRLGHPTLGVASKGVSRWLPLSRECFEGPETCILILSRVEVTHPLSNQT
jgi:hypothetical protein